MQSCSFSGNVPTSLGLWIVVDYSIAELEQTSKAVIPEGWSECFASPFLDNCLYDVVGPRNGLLPLLNLDREEGGVCGASEIFANARLDSRGC